MRDYQVLYRITVVHDYFGKSPSTILQCQLTPQGVLLARRRDLAFIQRSANEWVVYYDCQGEGPDTERDVLELELNMTDPIFTLCTEWKKFSLIAANVLQLPAIEEEMEVVSASQPLGEMRNMGRSFCTIALQLTKEVLDAARAGKPKSTTLRFYAPLKKWEYLFLQRKNEDIPIEAMRLEDAMGLLEFCALAPYRAYGRTFLRAVSNKAIPMRLAYENRLRLVVFPINDRQQKRCLLSRIEPPVPGHYQGEMPDMLREIYYF